MSSRPMTCREVRERLSERRPAALEARVAAHLEGCPSCERFAARLAAAQSLLRDHHAGVEPDGAFAARVVARLPRQPDLLGWAALRLLPATLALALVLAGWSWLVAPTPASLLDESPTDDLLTWVLDEQTPEPSSEEGS